jgi:hypothetical protein
MAPKEPEISKQTAASTMDITLTNPYTLEVTRKAGNAIS